MQMETQQLQALLLRNSIADKIFGEGNLSLGSCSEEDFFIFNLLTVVLLSACYRGRNFVVIYLWSHMCFCSFRFFSDGLMIRTVFVNLYSPVLKLSGRKA